MAPSDYVSGSGRTGNWHFFDPTGADGAGGNPKQDFIDSFKNTIKHELMHSLGLDDDLSDCGSIMSGQDVPNGKGSGGATCRPNDPTDCDAQALKNIYPQTFEDDPDYYYAECGIDGSVYFDCTHQVDQYWYNFDACDCELGTSPIIINLDGGSLALTSPANGVRFDLLATGSTVQTAWTTAGSRQAFLVLDRNSNGAIDDGSELFGNITQQPPPAANQERNGFLALAEFDKPSNGGNGDGIISAADSVFSKLRLWMDLNHDGISQPEEMLALASQGIESIDLTYHEDRSKDQFGNMLRYFGNVRLVSHPATRKAIDVFFKWVQ